MAAAPRARVGATTTRSPPASPIGSRSWSRTGRAELRQRSTSPPRRIGSSVRRGNAHRFALGIVSLGAGDTDHRDRGSRVTRAVLGLMVAWAGIVGVNAVFAWGNRGDARRRELRSAPARPRRRSRPAPIGLGPTNSRSGTVVRAGTEGTSTWPVLSSSVPARSSTPAATPPSRSRSSWTTGPRVARRSRRVPPPARSRPSSCVTGTSAATAARASTKAVLGVLDQLGPELLGYDASEQRLDRPGDARPRRHRPTRPRSAPTRSSASRWPSPTPPPTPPTCRSTATSVARTPTCCRCR